ncbi:MAG: hypothetical protein RI558_03975 [Psychroflexus sp.]|nr:hypothetical protein [Psychroflexus sp.]MDR9447988.1 hypothetical protein [Psychroflexus sp.]
MKKILLASFVFCILSCSSGNVVFVPELNKRVKVFKNDTFQFYYPKKWETFEMGEQFNDLPIVSLAPKKKIEKVYRIKKKIYGKNRKITLAESMKKKYPDFDFKNALKGKDSYSKVMIYINEGKLIDEIVTNYTSQNINSNRYKNFELTKVSGDFYIISYRKEGRTRNVEYSFGSTINKIYIKQKGDDVYEIIYKAGQYSYNDHKEDAGLIFRSFKFLAD